MAFLAFLQADAIADVLNSSEWVFPAAECFHIVFFAVAIGTIMVVDLRLLGLAFRGQAPAKLVRDTSIWTIIGLAVSILAGMVLFLSDPRMYSYNRSFRFKITMLVIAILYNYTVHGKVASGAGPSPAVGVVVGAVSVLLWASIVFGGLFIAFV
jgi:hypothetical protein